MNRDPGEKNTQRPPNSMSPIGDKSTFYEPDSLCISNSQLQAMDTCSPGEAKGEPRSVTWHLFLGCWRPCTFPVPGLSAGTCPSAPGSPLSHLPAYLLRKLRQCGPVQKELETRGHCLSSSSPPGGGLGQVTRLLRRGSP